MAFTEIGNAINTEMLKIKDTDLKLAEVYNYEPKIIANYPAIIITPTNGTNNYLDTCTDETTYNYVIRLVDDIQTDGEEVEGRLRELADLVITRLKDVSLEVPYTDWKTYKMLFDYQRGRTDNQQPQRVFEITAKFSGINKI